MSTQEIRQLWKNVSVDDKTHSKLLKRNVSGNQLKYRFS